jgi:hypothetical protein
MIYIHDSYPTKHEDWEITEEACRDSIHHIETVKKSWWDELLPVFFAFL